MKSRPSALQGSLLSGQSSFSQRLGALNQPHMLPLSAYRVRLLEKLPPGAVVPNFDPVSGGVQAAVLLLLETPGRVPRSTKFTSLDNPSATSKNLRALVAEAALDRMQTLMWNLVPWDVGTDTRIGTTSVRDRVLGSQFLLELIEQLPKLCSIVFFGDKAREAIPRLQAVRKDLTLIGSPHPSNQVLYPHPEKREEILSALSSAQRCLHDG